ncbi:hypothetical protein DFJ58DRAFT_453490 [Suillus subalutaceus]|uniref:uncharacterized protein n=1 Tax=Suillus subalutaceus TaxID=48586 RepID=UPI001B85CBD8|nr:uncharacterized protein DFJ58DRAFT_453490 [Suillus subalutaceus]KAG1849292.1 hypothetical protein DFJ58DRAFT_453490 [Suillus subalutaceus]
MSNIYFTPGSLYIAGFAQARAPHVGLIILTSLRFRSLRSHQASYRPSGRTNAEFSVSRVTCSSHRCSASETLAYPITPARLQEAAQAALAPQNDESGSVSRGCWQSCRSCMIWNLCCKTN